MFPTITQLLALENYNRVIENIYDQEDDDVDSISVTVVKEYSGLVAEKEDWPETPPTSHGPINAEELPATVPVGGRRRRRGGSLDTKHGQEPTAVAIYVDPDLETPSKKNPANLSNDFLKRASSTYFSQEKGEAFSGHMQKILPPGDVGAFLGIGAFGTVFEFMPDNGQAMALKIPTSNRADNIEPYKTIANLYEQLPPDVAKHFPKIYGVWLIRRTGKEFPIVLMEKLDELPGAVKAGEYLKRIEKPWEIPKAPKGPKNPHGEAKEDLLWIAMKDDDKVAIILKALYKSLNLSDKVAETFAQHMRKFADLSQNEQGIPKFKKWLDASVKIGVRTGIVPKGYDKHQTWKAHGIADKAGAYFARDFKGSKDPETQDAILKMQKKTAEKSGLSGLVNALHYMYEKHGMRFVDLHRGNVLIRPTDRAIVAADLGLFRFH